LKNLTTISGARTYYVDSSPIAADVKIDGAWKTIVVFGERRGGRSYHALNITDNAKIVNGPEYLWTFPSSADPKIGETWSEPAIGKIRKSDGTDIFVAFLGGGYDTAQNNNTGKAFYVINLADGSKLWEYYNNSSTDDRQYMNYSLAASPTAVDLNNDGYIDRVYIGDVGGQLWKFDVSAPAAVSGGAITNWDPAQKGKRVFAAAAGQANPPVAGEYFPAQGIYVPPALAYDVAGNLWIFLGTGDRNHPNNDSSNRFYGIKETTDMTNGSAHTLTEASLTNLTSGSGSVSQGWYVTLAGKEKVLAAPDVFNRIVFFTTFTPVTSAACGTGGGNAKLYAANMTSGDAALNLATGAVLPQGQSALAMSKGIGTGIPSEPIIILNPSSNTGNPYVITGTTNQQISNTPIPPVSIKRLLAWREVF
jgi:type IV pilus assembly protein PilY1